MSKRLTNLVCGGIFLVGSMFGCTDKILKTYEMADRSLLEVKSEEKLSVNSSGEGLVKVNGKLYVLCKENGETFLADFGPNANPRLIMDEDGTYDVADEDSCGMTYYDWNESGNLTKTHYIK